MPLILFFVVNLLVAVVLSRLNFPPGEAKGWLGFMWVVDLVALFFIHPYPGDSGDGAVGGIFFANLVLELVLVVGTKGAFDLSEGTKP